jgi:hypothetical protein
MPSVHEPVSLFGAEPALYSGMNLQRPIEEWWDTYARYVKGLGGTIDPLSPEVRLATDMGLPYAAQRRMTPRGDLPPRGAWYIPLVGYAMLVKGSHGEDVEIAKTPSSFVATHVSGRQFGVASGLPVGCLAATPPAYRLRHSGGLPRLLHVYGVTPKKPGLFDHLRAWIDANASKFSEDFGELRQALSILYWAHSGRLPNTLQELLFLSRDVELQYAVEYARHFADFTRPRAMLVESLVPEHLTLSRFRELFGYSGGETLPLSESQIHKWNRALDVLCPPTKTTIGDI